jgi:hypothetical protein
VLKQDKGRKALVRLDPHFSSPAKSFFEPRKDTKLHERLVWEARHNSAVSKAWQTIPHFLVKLSIVEDRIIVPRLCYEDCVMVWMGRPVIKVLSGIRRSGKSSILLRCKERLVAHETLCQPLVTRDF